MDLNNLIKKAKKDRKVIAIALYGSYAAQQEYRDIDVCLILDKKYDNLEMSKKKLEYAQFDKKLDIRIFQQLPIYIRHQILKGKIIFCKNAELLYKIAFGTIKEFEFFKKIQSSYLQKVR